jgi:hypothetical protein
MKYMVHNLFSTLHNPMHISTVRSEKEIFMNNVIQFKPKEHGQSMVELALTITMLMVLLAGTIDLGRAFFTWLAMRDAAQEGASYASINPSSANLVCPATSTEQICKRIWANLGQVVHDADAVVNVTVGYSGLHCLSADPNNPNNITILIDYTNFKLTMPFLGIFVGNTIPIRSTINDTIIAPTCD